jgi:predicted nucleic acid-binding protein
MGCLSSQQVFVVYINDILEEYQEILQIETSVTVAENLVSLLLNCQNVRLVYPTFRFQLIKADPDDNKFVDCAIVSGADYIVSEDSHFKILKSIKFPAVSVLTLDEFAKLL